MAEAGGYAPLDTTAGDEGPSALERIEAARATIAANKAARAARLSPLRSAAADQTSRMADEEEEGERAPLVEGDEVARSDEVVVAVGRHTVPDEHPPTTDDKAEDGKRRFRVRCCQSPAEIQRQAVREAEERHAAALEAGKAAADALPLEGKIEELWGWFDKHLIKYDQLDQRYLKREQITVMVGEMEVEREALCELLGARWESVRGPRAVYGGRAGTVIAIMSATERGNKDGVEKIQVHWVDDGTASPWDDEFGQPGCADDAIEVSELDEPLGEGSAVRHNGRRGTAATEPDMHGWIAIRWEDGTLSGSHLGQPDIKVSGLEVEVTVGREDFAAACHQHPERTARMQAIAARHSVDVELLRAKVAAAAAKDRACRVRCRRSLGCQSLEHIEQSLREADERHAAAPGAAAALPLEAKIEVLWGWAEGTRVGGCIGCSGERFLKYGKIQGMAEAAGMKVGEMCDLLGAEPVRGPRAVLGGRVGVMMARGESKIQVRWEDDGTESPGPDLIGCWPGDAIKVSDPDLALGEGSAVRHDGRRGTAATEPYKEDGYIRIRWEDDGTDSSYIEVSELEVEVTVGQEDFAAACNQQPERTAKMQAHLARRRAGAELAKVIQSAGASRQSCGVCARRVCAYRGQCRLHCKLCCFELGEYQPVRGHRTPAFLEVLGGVAMPTLDAWLDWGVTIAFYLSGDVYWFEAALTINLLSGLLSGGWLAWMLRDQRNLKSWWTRARKALVVALVGLPGLAPAAWTIKQLRALSVSDDVRTEGTKTLKQLKALELIIEALPQSMLQTYVGVAYGKFDPSSPTFSYLLPVSVTVSLLGAGSTVFGLEAEMRNAAANPFQAYGVPYKEVVSLGSRYGIVGLLLRTAQVTALIFWISLLACAEKGWAAGAVALGVLMFGGMCAEAAYRTVSKDRLGKEPKEVTGWKEWNSDAKRWLVHKPQITWRLLRLWQPPRSIRASLLWSALHLALLGAMAALFFDVQHVPNNYANKTLPMGGPGDPQHYDCHDRTSGLYPAYLASAVCVLLAPLYAALDPEHGVEWMQPQIWEEKNAAAEALMRTAAVSEEVDASLVEQVEALWTWVKGTVSNHKRVVKHGTIVDVAKAAEMEPEVLRELLGARWEPVRGPRAVLGGRAGTVIEILSADGDQFYANEDGVEKIRVRWDDDGTESPGPDDYGGPWPDDAIKVSDLDEPLGEGSAVRRNGRRGTAATEPRDYRGRECIKIRWEDDGTLSKRIKLSKLEVEVTVGREELATACKLDHERTAKMRAGLLMRASEDLKAKADAAVLEAKVAAVWRWADVVADGDIGATELRRLADRVGDSDGTAEEKYKKLCEALGLGPRAVLGGRAGTVIERSETDHMGQRFKDGVERIQVRWEDDGTESAWYAPGRGYNDAIKVSDLDEPLVGGWADAQASIGREAFAAACRAQKRVDVYGYEDEDGKRSVEGWFEALRLELEKPGPSSLASAIASWPLRILCIALSVVVVYACRIGDDGSFGSGSGSGSSSGSGSFQTESDSTTVVLLALWMSDDGAGSGSYDRIDDDSWPVYIVGVAVAVVSVVACDIKRIHGRKAAAHREATEKQVKEAVAQFEERKRHAEKAAEEEAERKNAASLAAATEQLQDVAGVAVEGLPQPELNDVYLPAGGHEGWPRFESGQGKHLFRRIQRGAWSLADELDPKTRHATFESADGRMATTGQEWRVQHEDDWKDAMLTVSLLESAEEVAEQTERLRLAREEALAELEAVRTEALPIVQEIFAMFDADGDGKLNKAEYEAYLRGIGGWGTGDYTDEKWDESWPEECEDMESGTEGIGLEAFESILYGKYRVGKAQADLDRCKQSLAEPEPEPMSEPEPEP